MIALTGTVFGLGPTAAMAMPTSQASTATKHALKGGQSLKAGQSIWSLNGSYELLMQTNGNLVEYGPAGAVWATATPATGDHATMQTDGNFVVYTSNGTALWQSGTGGNGNGGGFTLDLQNDGNLAIYGVPGGAIWSREGGPPLTYGKWPGTGGPGASTPSVGSVAWYAASSSSPSGHVAYVEQVNSPTSIVISEMNYDFDNGFWVHTITTSSGWPTSFIHIHDR